MNKISRNTFIKATAGAAFLTLLTACGNTSGGNGGNAGGAPAILPANKMTEESMREVLDKYNIYSLGDVTPAATVEICACKKLNREEAIAWGADAEDEKLADTNYYVVMHAHSDEHPIEVFRLATYEGKPIPGVADCARGEMGVFISSPNGGYDAYFFAIIPNLDLDKAVILAGGNNDDKVYCTYYASEGISESDVVINSDDKNFMFVNGDAFLPVECGGYDFCLNEKQYVLTYTAFYNISNPCVSQMSVDMIRDVSVDTSYAKYIECFPLSEAAAVSEKYGFEITSNEFWKLDLENVSALRGDDGFIFISEISISISDYIEKSGDFAMSYTAETDNGEYRIPMAWVWPLESYGMVE